MLGFKKVIPKTASNPVVTMGARASKPSITASEMAECKGREAALRTLIGAFLGVEKLAKAEAKHEHTAVLKRIQQLEKIPIVVAATNGMYQLIDLEPLKWRTEKGDPMLAVFGLEEGTFLLQTTITVGMYRRTPNGVHWREEIFKDKVTPLMPEDMKACYTDVFEALRERGRKELPWFINEKEHSDDFSISAQFQGFIPNEVKAKIDVARKAGVFQDFFLVAEAKDVVHSKASGSDPLVLGWDGLNYWLIATFMTTSLEEHIALEYTHKP